MYLPDLPKPAYQDLLIELRQELTYTFGGCTILRGLDGSYLSRAGEIIEDRITLLYSDLPLTLDSHLDMLSRYTDHLRDTADRALQEEAILVVVHAVHHAEYARIHP